MSRPRKLSTIADDFPTVEADVEDMLSWPYKFGGRDASGIDCYGVTLELYRRAGIGLPDPSSPGESIESLQDNFERVDEPSQLYDLVYMNGGLVHVSVVCEIGVAISAREMVGVYRTPPLRNLKPRPSLIFYRLKPSSLT